MSVTNIEDMIHQLNERHEWTKEKIDLDRFKKYVEYKGNPQLDLQCIHISGTNGKGSTSKALQVILTQAGYTVGNFNSPNIESHFDSIRINGQPVTEADYMRYVEMYFDEWIQFDLSLFEVDVFVSFLYFLEKKVDYVIYEVGMGGKDDATNVIHPLISCITNIGLDHCSFLGDTYEKIARNKAGIIKENSLFITNEKRDECIDVFKEICHTKHTKIKKMYSPYHIQVTDCLQFDTDLYKNIQVPTIAFYQAENIAFALSILNALKEEHIVEYKEQDVYNGLKSFQWIARFEVIQKDPLIILDGAHNMEGIHALTESCKGIKDLRILFSALQDKPYDEMLDQLSSVSKDITVCEFDFYRAESAEKLAENHDVHVMKDFKEAIQILRKDRSPLLICGSLYFISQVRKEIVWNSQR